MSEEKFDRGLIAKSMGPEDYKYGKVVLVTIVSAEDGTEREFWVTKAWADDLVEKMKAAGSDHFEA